MGAEGPSAKSSTTVTNKLLSASLTGEIKRLHRQTSLKGGGRSSLSQERTRAERERNSWNQASVTSVGCDSAVPDESRTTAVLAAKPPHASMHSSATGAKRRSRRRKTRKKTVTPSVTSTEGDSGAALNGSDQKTSTEVLKSNVSNHSQSSDQEAEQSPAKQTVSPASLDLPPPNSPTHTGENRNVQETGKERRKKMRRQGGRRLLTVRGRFPLFLSSHSRSTRKSFHPVLFHSRTDFLLHHLQLLTVKEEFTFLVYLKRELARKPSVR